MASVLQVVSELRSEMGPLTVAQRVEHLEDVIAEMVLKAVERAVDAMHHSLSEMIIEGQTKATKQLGADLDALAGRLEGRVQRTREFHESMINSMKDEQLKFQSEIRSTLTGLQGSQVPLNKKTEGSVNKMGVSPTSMVALTGSDNFAQGIGGSGLSGECGRVEVMEGWGV